MISELVEFLNARLGDEAGRHVRSKDECMRCGDSWPCGSMRDVESKRIIVAAYVKWSAKPQAKFADFGDGFAAGLEAAVEVLAARYADHREYRDEMRPSLRLIRGGGNVEDAADRAETATDRLERLWREYRESEERPGPRPPAS
ncbi:DUF6221 family protein [Actinomadura bangladeshensis]|uniref:Uncharacterized protein n=1 Tax=Actinomadura bangladeshensis TaxID=453573 RepID=A0A6L9QC59_9ACTN|nr:DUF6221 family protein [Actinomadura bangladeshensis]NEA22672.1 hypothetical protein [Actinomadura bangladeshensis]